MSFHTPLDVFFSLFMFDIFLFFPFVGYLDVFVCSFKTWFQSFLSWTLRMKDTVILLL